MSASPEPDRLLDQFAVGTTAEAAVAVARMMSVARATLERRAQLEHALRSRIAIEQAKGIVAERYGLDIERAFELLRNAARANRIKLHELASRVRPNAATPPEITTLLESGRHV
jgi:AmiR/NasT family two-component response regulator